LRLLWSVPVHFRRTRIRSRRIKTVLKLYVVGGTQPSERAITAVADLLRVLDDDAEVEVVDLRTQPDLAERERILATPLLVRVEPPPVRRLVGDLTDTERVLWTLGLERAAG
jgi:circadian clock protein KaiB